MIERAFVVLSAFDPDHSELGVGELARRTALPKATVHRIATKLAELGMLRRVGQRYRIGLALFELGSLVFPRGLRELTLPYLEDLHAVTHETVHLAVLHDTEVVYLERITGHGQARSPSRFGGRMPSYCTGLGKAMLAYSPRAVVDQVVAAGLEPKTPHTVVDPARFRSELAAIERRGVAFDREESQAGLVCVAVPLLGADRRLIGAVSVAGAKQTLDLSRVAPAVETVGLAISRSLRRRPPAEIGA